MRSRNEDIIKQREIIIGKISTNDRKEWYDDKVRWYQSTMETACSNTSVLQAKIPSCFYSALAPPHFRIIPFFAVIRANIIDVSFCCLMMSSLLGRHISIPA